MWLAALAQAWSRTGWRIQAWALMSNHYHLLLETPEPNLVSGMKWLQGTYTQRLHGTSGVGIRDQSRMQGTGGQLAQSEPMQYYPASLR